jgi:beta-carotene ketolase (CrtW type)
MIASWTALFVPPIFFAWPAPQWSALVPFWILAQALAFTGLFITAHEAMHGLVAPRHPRLNHAVGRVALALYAGMGYRALRLAHGVHHAEPSTVRDPDFHEPPGGGFFQWYVRFILNYATWWQIVWMALAFNLLRHVVGVPLETLWLFWFLPQAISTLQLFGVGTYLPHRTGRAFEGEGPTRTRSVALPSWLSFLACFHFGYHFEHHRWPSVPWWRLPLARQWRLSHTILHEK